MRLPVISVIIPLRDARHVLPVCLESLLSQTFRDWEALLVDDGSTDASADVCRDFARRDPRFFYLRREHGGVSAARNTGLAGARGAYLFFLDADDALPPSALEALYAGARRTGADLVCGQAEICLAGRPAARARSPEEALLFTGAAVKENLFHPHLSLFSWGKLCRRELFSAIRFPEGRRFEDAFTTPRVVFAARRMLLLPDVVYFYRQHPGSITHCRGGDYYLDWTDAFAACEALCARECPALLAEAHSRYLQSYLRALDRILCWPAWRTLPGAAAGRSFVRAHLRELLGDPYLRPARKVFAIGAALCPDLVSLALRLHRWAWERSYRRQNRQER